MLTPALNAIFFSRFDTACLVTIMSRAAVVCFSPIAFDRMLSQSPAFIPWSRAKILLTMPFSSFTLCMSHPIRSATVLRSSSTEYRPALQRTRAHPLAS